MDRRDVLIAGSSLFAANLLSAAPAESAPALAARPPMRTVKIRNVVIGEGRVKTSCRSPARRPTRRLRRRG